MYRYLHSLYYRAFSVSKERLKLTEREVSLFSIHGKDVAFYNHYIEVTKRNTYHAPQDFVHYLNEIAPYLECIIFIPTKYRVYSKILNQTIPNAHWDYLNKITQKKNLCSMNLTPELMKKSDELLSKGEFTWWRDDTHWNHHEIRVAAEKLKKRILKIP